MRRTILLTVMGSLWTDSRLTKGFRWSFWREGRGDQIHLTTYHS